MVRRGIAIQCKVKQWHGMALALALASALALAWHWQLGFISHQNFLLLFSVFPSFLPAVAEMSNRIDALESSIEDLIQGHVNTGGSAEGKA